jgi:hypothetical protein
MTTDLNEVTDFLEIAGRQGFLNDNTVAARRTACNKLFDIIDPENKTVEYVRDNLDVVKGRFSNLNRDVRGDTVNEYARRVQLVLDDFTEWKADRAAWERKVSSRQSNRPTNDAEKVVKLKAHKARNQTKDTDTSQAPESPELEARMVNFPIRPDFDLQVRLPRNGLTVQELKKLVYFLLPYAQDWEPTESPRHVFQMLERDDRRV